MTPSTYFEVLRSCLGHPLDLADGSICIRWVNGDFLGAPTARFGLAHLETVYVQLLRCKTARVAASSV